MALCLAPRAALAEEAAIAEAEVPAVAETVAEVAVDGGRGAEEQELPSAEADGDKASEAAEAPVAAEAEANEAAPVESDETEQANADKAPSGDDGAAVVETPAAKDEPAVLEVASVNADDVLMLTSAETKSVILKKGWNQGPDGVWYWSSDGKNAAHGWQRLNGVWY